VQGPKDDSTALSRIVPHTAMQLMEKPRKARAGIRNIHSRTAAARESGKTRDQMSFGNAIPSFIHRLHRLTQIGKMQDFSSEPRQTAGTAEAFTRGHSGPRRPRRESKVTRHPALSPPQAATARTAGLREAASSALSRISNIPRRFRPHRSGPAPHWVSSCESLISWALPVRISCSAR
jgi:hypothetical protein